MITSMITPMISPMITSMIRSSVTGRWFISLDPVATTYYTIDTPIPLLGGFALKGAHSSVIASAQVLFGDAVDDAWCRINANGSVQIKGAGADSTSSTGLVVFDGKLHIHEIIRIGSVIKWYLDDSLIATLSGTYTGEIEFTRFGNKVNTDEVDGILADMSIDDQLIPDFGSSVQPSTSISEAPTITESGSDQLSGTVYLSTDTSAFNYIGGSVVEEYKTTNSSLTPKSTNLVGATSNDRSAKVCAFEFETSSDQFEIRMGTVDDNGNIRLIIDDEIISEINPSLDRILIDYSAFSTKTRKIRVEYRAEVRLFSVRVENSEAITKTTLQNLTSITILGDSFTVGSGAPDTEKHDSYAAFASKLLGITDYRCSAVGGSGYLMTGSGLPNLKDRIGTDGVSSDLFIIAMGINDTNATITTDINTTFNTIRSNNPSQPIYVLSAWGDGFGVELKPLINASIQAAISGRIGFYYIPVWQVNFTKSDSTHPDLDGHKTLGSYVAQQIRLITSDVTTFRIDQPTDNTETSVEGNNTVTYNNISAGIREFYTLVDDGVNWLGADELWVGALDYAGTGWTDNLDGSYACDGTQVGFSAIRINDKVLEGLAYRCEITVFDYSAGTVRIKAGNQDSPLYSSNGSFTDDQIPSSSDVHLRITGNADFDGSVNEISFKRLIEIA